MSRTVDLILSQVDGVMVISAPAPVLPHCLSESEREIVRAVLRGLSNAEIAGQRKSSAKTIANQLYTIYRKLGVGGRDELVLRVTSPRADESSSEPGESS